jgi:hypothetical protein
VLVTTRSREAARLALRGDTRAEQHADGANFEVVEADAGSLAEFIEFDDRTIGNWNRA